MSSKTLFIFFTLFTNLLKLPQTEKPIQRHDSVNVSAGISKEQLVLEDKLNGVISRADELQRNGNMIDAIKQYESALEFVHKQPLLTEQESRVMEKLARGYVKGNRAADAVPIYSKLISKVQDCRSDCASLQFSLGMAQMSALDFQGALSSFQSAELNYAKASKLSEIHESMMIDVKDEAQAKIYRGVALFKIGKTADAIATVEAAIPLLNRVQSDETLLISIRDDAKRSLQEAKTVLARLQSGE